jgi:hypothetical protein
VCQANVLSYSFFVATTSSDKQKQPCFGVDWAEGPSCQVANTCTFIITVDMCVVVMLSSDWTRDMAQEIYRLRRLNFPFV